MNRLDKIIGFFSPKTAAKRQQYRDLIGVLEERKFDAASRGRRTSGWKAPGSSGNSAIEGQLETLRNRSRDSVRNNVWASRASRVIPANVVGSGIRPAPKMKSQKRVDALKEIWKEFADGVDCDFEGQLNFYAIERLVMQSVVESGEALVIRRKIRNPKPGQIPIQLQVLEADHLDHTRHGQTVTGGGVVYWGIEFDSDGRRVAYWIYPSHPGETGFLAGNLVSERYPAEDVAHIYNKERPGQIRGVPFGSASLLKARDFEEYEDAQLMRQKIAACFSVFVTTPEDPPPGQTNPNSDFISERVEPGLIEYLAPGKQVSFGAPPPAENYDEYSRKILQGISAGYGMTYEAMTNDYSNVNFSSGRMGWIEFGRQVSQWQTQMLVPMLCSRVWDWFIEAAFLAGVINENKVKAEWTPPRREMIDPVKETKGLSELVLNGFHSWQDIVRQLGKDPNVVLKELAEDAAAFDAAGLKLTSDGRNVVKSTDKTPDPQKSEEE